MRKNYRGCTHICVPVLRVLEPYARPVLRYAEYSLMAGDSRHHALLCNCPFSNMRSRIDLYSPIQGISSLWNIRVRDFRLFLPEVEI
jgi:hypothetical protein